MVQAIILDALLCCQKKLFLLSKLNISSEKEVSSSILYIQIKKPPLHKINA